VLDGVTTIECNVTGGGGGGEPPPPPQADRINAEANTTNLIFILLLAITGM
jgi:hypothetical protein